MDTLSTNKKINVFFTYSAGVDEGTKKAIQKRKRDKAEEFKK
jgi:hypothetical protein